MIPSINGRPGPRGMEEPDHIRGKHILVAPPFVVAMCSIMCVCRRAQIQLTKPGEASECPVCRRQYVVSGIRYNMQESEPEQDGKPAKRAQVFVDIARADPAIMPPGVM